MGTVYQLALALLALLLAGCNRAAPPPADPLFVNLASQDRALFARWNAAPATRRVTLRWRRAGTDQWLDADAGLGGNYLIAGLENGATYECYGERELDTGARITSAIVTHVPRARRFDWGPFLFTSQQAADAWLAEHGIDPRSFLRHGQPVRDWGPNAPDGMYTSQKSGQLPFRLMRFADEVFRPPNAARPPEQVRTVLKHALWPTANPFDHPERFPMPITSIEPPLVGTVRRFATADSFAIRYHPQLSSRCTRFTPPKLVPKRVAIYLHGHQGHTVRFGGHTIDKLLDHGWQVIAVDMPLIGANSEDVAKDLRIHNSFLFWQTDDFCPVSLFLQPLVALVDQIYREHGTGSDLTVMLIGKSGGGWTSYMYGALDPRIHYAVSVASGIPLSLRLGRWPLQRGDYEQLDPRVYEAVPYEDIMPAAGSRGAFYVFNEHDPCCAAFAPDDPFVRYLLASGRELEKPIGVYVDQQTTAHTFTNAAFDALVRFIATVERGAD